MSKFSPSIRPNPHRSGSRGTVTRVISQRGTIALGIVIGAAISAFCVVLIPRTYTAVAEISVMPPTGFVGAFASRTTSSKQSKFLVDEAEIMRSPAVLSLASGEGEFGKLRAFNGVSLPADLLRKSLSIQATAGRGLIVTFDAYDPDEAKRVVDSIVTAYRHHQTGSERGVFPQLNLSLKQQHQNAAAEFAIYKDRLHALRSDISKPPAARAIDRLIAVADDRARLQEQITITSEIFDLAAVGAGINPVGLDQTIIAQRMLREQAADSSSEVASTIILGNTTVTGASTSMPAPKDTPALDATLQLKQARAQAQGQIDRIIELRKSTSSLVSGDLSSNFWGDSDTKPPTSANSNHQTTVNKLQRELANLKPLNREVLGAAAVKLESLLEQQRQLDREFKKSLELAKTLSPHAQSLADAAVAARTASTRLTRIDQQSDLLQVSASAGAPLIDIISQARVDHPAHPPTPLLWPTIVKGSLLGLLGGIGLATVRTRRGTDGLCVAQDSLVTLRLRALDPCGDLVTQLAVRVGQKNCLPATLLFTSPLPATGKTRSTFEFAIAMSNKKLKVLLVDLNYNSPAAHKLAGLHNGQGLTEALAGAKLHTLIQSTSDANIDVLTAGQADIKTASLLNSDRLVEIINQLTAAYDHVIFDAGQANIDDDARVVANAVDSTVLVVRQGPPFDHNALATAIDRLTMVGANVVGVVVRPNSERDPSFPKPLSALPVDTIKSSEAANRSISAEVLAQRLPEPEPDASADRSPAVTTQSKAVESRLIAKANGTDHTVSTHDHVTTSPELAASRAYVPASIFGVPIPTVRPRTPSSTHSSAIDAIDSRLRDRDVLPANGKSHTKIAILNQSTTNQSNHRPEPENMERPTLN